ncbi:MAG: FAD-dependent oxidoreductase [Gammaproteobacteria bacterium]
MTHQWAVIGAGPAGIAAVGKLIDNGISPKEIAWVDPSFSVGDFGTLWRNVSSNTKADLFLKFLNASAAFDYQNSPKDFALNHAPRNKTCELRLMGEPLQWVTNHLKEKVHALTGFAEKLSLRKRTWHIELTNGTLQATNVILAMGAEAKSLALPAPAIIPLHDALDTERLNNHLDTQDTIAVFGSSHSAVLVLKNLVETAVKRIINFYRSPFIYAVYLDDWILFDDIGLKGSAAEWAHQNLDGEMPTKLTRFYSNQENIDRHLPQCTKVVYAVGFERRTLPVIDDMPHLDYMEQSGIIAPGLFGLGVAFPEGKYDRLGTLEYRVGLWKFMDYLHRVMPIWLKYSP